MLDEKKLNSPQLEAITHTTGPLLIIAGAGTGKTTVITERVSWLLSQGLAKPEELLCLTFTEKASLEMETRIDQVLPLGYAQLWVTTFHSFCDRILKDEALNIGIDPNYKLLTESDSISLLESELFNLPLSYYRPLGNPQKFLQGLLQHVSRLKDEDVTPAQYQEFVKSVSDPDEKIRLQELADLYSAYEELKIKRGVMDFSDLISHTLNLFRTRPKILQIYQEKFKFILVDEFQDTNYSQNILVNLLSGTKQNLTVVADDDQAIYRWRGAAVSNVIQFKKTYPNAKLIVLVENYRSTQTILDSSYSLIQNNNPDRLEIKENINKRLVSSINKKGDPVELIHANRVDEEAELVIKKINSVKIKHGYSYKDFAILVRANAHSEPFVRALSYSQIPYKFLGPTKLYDSSEVIELIAFLKVLSDINDNLSFYQLISMEYFQISGRDLASITSFSKKANQSLFETCEIFLEKLLVPNGVTLPKLSPESLKTLEKIVELVSSGLNDLSQISTGQILYNFLSVSGILNYVIDYKHPYSQDRSLNVIKLFEKIKSYELIHPKSTLFEVVKWLEFVSQYGENSQASDSDTPEDDSVSILTIHASKGLEFPVVFVVNMVTQRFPSTQRKEQIPIPDGLIKEELPTGDFHLQEERRLCYVAITRAKSHLILTTSDFYGDGKRQRKISPFVSEILGPDYEKLNLSATTKQLSLLEMSVPQSKAIKNDTPPLRIDYLSYSQIQTFITCPLHYKAKYILNIPTPPSAPSSFGNTIHLTFKDFYNQVSRQTNISTSEKFTELILDIYQKDWSPVGYSSKEYEREYFQKGKKYLQDFINEEFDPLKLPIKLEEPFTIPIVSKDGTRMIKIGGKMDRVDLLSDGSIEIIDYKTSHEAMDQKEADNGLQLSFYALAATTIPTQPFGKDPDQVTLTLYYFETKEKIKTTRTRQQLESAKEEIFEFAEKITNSEFKCSNSPLCNSCDFHQLCRPGS